MNLKEREFDLHERVAKMEAVLESLERHMDSIDSTLKDLNRNFHAWLRWVIGLVLANIGATAAATLTVLNVLKR